ncbi:MAG: DsbA family protein [Candidatus Gottesmanbacteria bacterium]
MICVIALIIFSVLGIFSATHRALAKEALDCVFRRVTFRPCTTGFNEKIKGKVIGRLLNRSVIAARIFNKHFEIISWIFVILTVGSTFFTVKGAYNYYLYGSCNGLNQSGFCAFDPAGENNKVSQVATQCNLEKPTEKDLILNNVDLSLFPTKGDDAKDKIVFIGCYSCDYTRKAYPLIQKLVKNNKVSFIFAHFPVKDQTNFLSEFGYCAYKQDKDKFWQLNDKIFAADKNDIGNIDNIEKFASNVGYNLSDIRECIADPSTRDAVDNQMNELQKTHIYGTPTIFINGKVFIGAKPYRVYERALKGWRFW